MPRPLSPKPLFKDTDLYIDLRKVRGTFDPMLDLFERKPHAVVVLRTKGGKDLSRIRCAARIVLKRKMGLDEASRYIVSQIEGKTELLVRRRG